MKESVQKEPVTSEEINLSQPVTSEETNLSQPMTSGETSLSQPMTSGETNLSQRMTSGETSLRQPLTSRKSNDEMYYVCNNDIIIGKSRMFQLIHKLAQDIRRNFKEDCSKPHTVSFDMEKTLPLPYIQTNKVFYLLQLWLYNEGFNHTVDNQAYMYCWTEGTAKRGSIEVISCMLKFVRSVASTWPKLVLWCDTCGGQNCNFNINMTAFLITLVNESNLSINKVTHRYLWSEHSFLPNDTDFSHIEKKKKDAMGIYSAEE